MREKIGASGWLATGLGVLAVLVSAIAPAAAHPTSATLAERFSRGDYIEAAALAEEAASADDLAFAARSLLAHCMTGSAGPDARLIERAVRDAEAALRLDPDHQEGRLQLAIALSLKSRDMDLMAVWAAGYGEKGRKLAEEVLNSAPQNFYAHGFLAVWNLEVMRRGGGMGAWVMGASAEASRKHYDQARMLAPDDVGIHWQYARALAAFDLNGRSEEVKAALGRALAAVASDHVERVMQARARSLSETLALNRETAQRLAQSLL